MTRESSGWNSRRACRTMAAATASAGPRGGGDVRLAAQAPGRLRAAPGLGRADPVLGPQAGPAARLPRPAAGPAAGPRQARRPVLGRQRRRAGADQPPPGARRPAPAARPARGADDPGAEGETVALAPGRLATDVAELEACLASGTRDALERAVALYGGDLLGGFQAREPLLEEWLG